MSTIIDNVTYSVFMDKYNHEREKFATLLVGITGDPIRIEAGAFRTQYPLTLICNTTQVQSLLASYNKTSTAGSPPANLLLYTDEEGITYDPAAGTDTATRKFSTGIWLDGPSGKITPKPMTPKGWSTRNLFLVDILVTIKSKVIT